MQALVTRLLPSAHVLAQLAVQIGLTVAVSAASYALFESRFLVLKDRWFPARRARPNPGWSARTKRQSWPSRLDDPKSYQPKSVFNACWSLAAMILCVAALG